MLALAETKANTSQQEVLALVIDRETSNEVSRINREIGQSVYFHSPRSRFDRLTDCDRLTEEFGTAYDQGKAQVRLGNDVGYEEMLIEYTQLKLYLHQLRKSCYWHGDPYAEREDIDVKGILERCDELKQVIKERRRVIRFAAWGGMEPVKNTAYDKPPLYAFDEYTCSHEEPLDTKAWEELTKGPVEPEMLACPFKGEHWYHGKPYCRTHLGEARRAFKLERRMHRPRWKCTKEPGCQVRRPHYHEFGRIHYGAYPSADVEFHPNNCKCWRCL